MPVSSSGIGDRIKSCCPTTTSFKIKPLDCVVFFFFLPSMVIQWKLGSFVVFWESHTGPCLHERQTKTSKSVYLNHRVHFGPSCVISNETKHKKN